MAAIDTTRTAYGSASVANRFGSLITALIGKVIAWNDARVTRKTLGGLTDRELEDIGLVRGDSDAIADRRF